MEPKRSLPGLPRSPKDGLSSGATLLNLLCTGHPAVAFWKGGYYYVVGDTSTGKTYLCMGIFAEATINPEFRDYRLIYDNVEKGMHIDLGAVYNETLTDRIEPPSVRKHKPVHSDTAESFYFNLDNAIHAAGWDSKERKPAKDVASPRPFIYILDSADSLDSEASDKKFHERKSAYERRKAGKGGDDAAGSYGDGKAKINSEYLRKSIKGLEQTGSILIIISQTRSQIGGWGGGTKTHSGGHGLDFYANHQIWTSLVKRITKTVRGRKRKVGRRVRLAVRKNRGTGQEDDVLIDIFPTMGFDNLGACVDYLVTEKHWRKKGGKIVATDLGASAPREKLLRIIERRGYEDKVAAACKTVYEAVAMACAPRRKNRYALAAAAMAE